MTRQFQAIPIRGPCGGTYHNGFVEIHGQEESEPMSPDPNVEAVRKLLLERSQAGLQKYGTTTERTDIDLLGWLNHLQQELCDAAVYIERIKGEVK